MEARKGFFWIGDINEWFVGHQFAEIFKDRIYDPYFIGKKDLTVIDIGSNLGIFSLYAQPFAKTIIALDPSLEANLSFTKMVEYNQFTNITPLKLALSNTDGTQIFYHRPMNKTMNSLTPDVKTDDNEEVETIRLDTLFKKFNIEHVDILKLDCEGTEYSIIGGDAFANVADKIDTLIGEYHNWGQEGRNTQQFVDSFENNGFSYKSILGEANLFVAQRLK